MSGKWRELDNKDFCLPWHNSFTGSKWADSSAENCGRFPTKKQYTGKLLRPFAPLSEQSPSACQYRWRSTPAKPVAQSFSIIGYQCTVARTDSWRRCLVCVRENRYNHRHGNDWWVSRYLTHAMGKLPSAARRKPCPKRRQSHRGRYQTKYLPVEKRWLEDSCRTGWG